MPSITLQIQNPSGPLVQVMIGVSALRKSALDKAGKPVPPPVMGTFLIDSGASCTCIDPSLIAKLGIPATGAIPIQTPSTEGSVHNCNTYDVVLAIPGAVNSGLVYLNPGLSVVETSLLSQGIEGLIGRDILNDCLLIYNGVTGQYTLSH